MSCFIRSIAREQGLPARSWASLGCRAVSVLSVIGLLLALPPCASIARAASPAAAAATPSSSGPSLESAASKAGSLGRNVAMSLIGLGFAVSAIRLVFRRSFKEAAGVFVVGLLAILLVTPAGVNVLHDTVNTLFGSS